MSAPSHGGDRMTALASAIIAVLAALATLFAHHRSISALSLKNDAVLTTAKASDLYASYQTKRLRISFYDALGKPDAIATDQSASISTLAEARKLQDQSASQEEQSEKLLQSYETFEIAATLFEIAIVFASISALTASRPMLWFGLAISAAGIIMGAIGFLQPH